MFGHIGVCPNIHHLAVIAGRRALGDVAADGGGDGRHGEHGGVGREHRAAGQAREQVRGQHALAVAAAKRLAGAERQPAGQVADQLADYALDDGDPGQRDGDRADQVAGRRPGAATSGTAVAVRGGLATAVAVVLAAVAGGTDCPSAALDLTATPSLSACGGQSKSGMYQ